MAYFQAEFAYLHPPALAFSCKICQLRASTDRLLGFGCGFFLNCDQATSWLLSWLRLLLKNGHDQPSPWMYFFSCDLELNLPHATALTWASGLALHITGLMKVHASSQVPVPQETHSPLTGPEIPQWCMRVVLPAMETGRKEDTSLISVSGDDGRMKEKNTWIQVLSTPYES